MKFILFRAFLPEILQGLLLGSSTDKQTPYSTHPPSSTFLTIDSNNRSTKIRNRRRQHSFCSCLTFTHYSSSAMFAAHSVLALGDNASVTMIFNVIYCKCYICLSVVLPSTPLAITYGIALVIASRECFQDSFRNIFRHFIRDSSRDYFVDFPRDSIEDFSRYSFTDYS